MHELSVAMGIIDVVTEELRRCGGRVAVVHVKLGPLSGVVKGALVPAYELARQGTPLAGASLEVEEVPVVARCAACGREHRVGTVLDLRCPVCGGPMPDVVSGRELEVVALEIEP